MNAHVKRSGAPAKSAAIETMSTPAEVTSQSSTAHFRCTILTCAEPDTRATKLYRGDAFGEPESYKAGYHFRAESVGLETFDEFVRLLSMLEPNEFLIRGEPAPYYAEKFAAGKAFPRRSVDKGIEPTFIEVPKRWLVLDADETETPFDLINLEGCVKQWHATLPAELREARSAFFLSAQAHRSETVRGKLVVELAEPLDNASACAYAGANGFDASVSRTVQPNYFAAPIFEGCADPLEGKRAPIMFEGKPACLPRVDPVKHLGTMRAGGSVPKNLPEPSERARELASLLEPRWLEGDRVETNAWLHLAGWLLGKGWEKGEIGALLVLLDDQEFSTWKRVEHWHILGNASPLSGPGAARAWLAEDFAAVDAIVNPAAANAEAFLASKPEPLAMPNPHKLASVAEYVRARDIVAFDERKRSPVRRENGRRWQDADTALLRLELSRKGVEVPTSVLEDAIAAVAREQAFDPVVAYLKKLPVWDGVTRSGFALYFGATPGPWADACWRVLSVSAVARALAPGCKVDTMVCLSGAQGAGKSSGLRALAGAEWFSDSDVALDSAKEVSESLSGVWLKEIAELSGLRGRDSQKIKACLSSQVDLARMAYGRHTEEMPRRSIFVATYNPDGSEWLTDTTGNRRYLPLECGTVSLAGLRRDRDQLWAEALHRYQQGEQWWLTAEEEALQRDETEARTEHDPWEETLAAWLATEPGKISVAAVLDKVEPGLEKTQARANRAARALKAHGWIKVRQRDGAVRTWAYERGPGAVPMRETRSAVRAVRMPLRDRL